MQLFKRGYIAGKTCPSRVQKNRPVSYGGNPYSVRAKYAGNDVAVIG